VDTERPKLCPTCGQTLPDLLEHFRFSHPAGEDDVVRHYMAERAMVVRRLGDVVADMNAQRDLESVLDRIAASLRELTSADAGGFVIIEGDTLRLVTVEDEGIGIAEGDQERIFDRFVQGEAGDRRRFGGVGIGLFIVRRLAEAQQAEVTASSRACGGTTMRLCLRVADDTAEA
jgi:signal transduction histidine kinase